MDETTGTRITAVASTTSTTAKWGERGSAAVELALAAPVFLLLACAGIDLGRLILTSNTLTRAVGEGASYAASLDDPLARQDEVRAVVRDFALTLGQDSVMDSQIAVQFDGQRVSILINEFPFVFVTPLPAWLGLSDVRITRTTTMRWELAPLP